jgi:hypothetical protein
VQNVLHATAATIAVTTGAPVSFDARSFERTNEPEAAPARKEASPLN